MDIEEGAGNQAAAGPNLVHFVRKLRSIKPDIIIGQPTYGYPQVEAANDVINESWDNNGNLKNVVDSIGIMVYEGTQSLMYVKNFVHGTDQWEGFPIKVDCGKNLADTLNLAVDPSNSFLNTMLRMIATR